MSNRIALVTGATGYIGSHLCAQLRRDGWQVHAIVRPTSVTSRLTPDVGLHTLDEEPRSARAIVKQVEPDVLFHLATTFGNPADPTALDSMITSNIALGAHLAQAVSELGSGTVVNVGSYWQSYDSAPYAPVTFYAATKQAMEDLLTYYREVEELNVVNVRLFDTYGPDDWRNKIVTLLLSHARSGLPIKMTHGHQLVGLVHVDDVVGALLRAATLTAPGPFEVVSEFLSIRELVDLIGATTGRPIKARWDATLARPREMMTPWNAGLAIPDWKPRNLSDALAKIWAADAT